VGNDTWSGILEQAQGESPAAYLISIGTLSAGGTYSINFTGAVFAITESPTLIYLPQKKSILTRMDKNVLFTQGVQGWVTAYPLNLALALGTRSFRKITFSFYVYSPEQKR